MSERAELERAIGAIEAQRTTLVEAYVAKLPNAKVFVSRPGVEMFLLEPSFAVCARGLFERFEIDFRAGAAPD